MLECCPFWDPFFLYVLHHNEFWPFSPSLLTFHNAKNYGDGCPEGGNRWERRAKHFGQLWGCFSGQLRRPQLGLRLQVSGFRLHGLARSDACHLLRAPSQAGSSWVARNTHPIESVVRKKNKNHNKQKKKLKIRIKAKEKREETHKKESNKQKEQEKQQDK